MNRYRTNDNQLKNRQGSIMPAIAIALLAIGAAAGLVLNRLWIDAAEAELKNAAESAALTAMREYLGDDLLLDQVDYEAVAFNAKQKAAKAAASNRVAGQSVKLEVDDEDNEDIYFGFPHEDNETGDRVFLHSNSKATGVVVRTYRSRQIGNPLRLFFAGVTKQTEADAIVYSEVSFDNTIDHFRPTDRFLVPAIPLAILANDPAGKRTDTWFAQIEQKMGADQYRFDQSSRTVLEEADGIPEMVLRSVPLNAPVEQTNVLLLDVNNALNESKISEQIQAGLSAENLLGLGEILPAYQPFRTVGNANITTEVQKSLEALIGQQRICLLYESQKPLSTSGWAETDCRGTVAIRVLKVIPESQEAVTLIIQPTVMTTKTANLSREVLSDQTVNTPTPSLNIKNRYLYKMFVTR